MVAGTRRIEPTVSSVIAATKVTMLMPTNAPRNGMKCSSPAITPHNNGFGSPRKYIAIPIAVPKNALIRHIGTVRDVTLYLAADFHRRFFVFKTRQNSD